MAPAVISSTCLVHPVECFKAGGIPVLQSILMRSSLTHPPRNSLDCFWTIAITKSIICSWTIAITASWTEKLDTSLRRRRPFHTQPKFSLKLWYQVSLIHTIRHNQNKKMKCCFIISSESISFHCAFCGFLWSCKCPCDLMSARNMLILTF